MRAVLAFHGVDDSGDVLTVSAAQLRSLVQAIRASGHQIVPLRTLLDEPSRGARVAFSFDDGFRSVAEVAAPLFRELDVPATLFLTTGYVGKDNGWPSQPPRAPRTSIMDWREVTRLAGEGWAIEAHTVSHPDLRTLSDAELEAELVAAREAIAAHTGLRPALFAYPYGYFDARVARAVSAHYRYAVTTVCRPLGKNEERTRVPRIDAYYLRAPLFHRAFGGTRFKAYVAARQAGRRLRNHPGEIDA